jgi:hypothetical protein
MIRAHVGVAWSAHLAAEDLCYLDEQIDATAWYPMATFERMGNAILRIVARGDLIPVRIWGRMSAAQLYAAHPELLAPDDPSETLVRFRVMRETFFDFEALEVPMLHDGAANIVIRYHMGMPAEEAASVQTMGFFEGLLELAHAKGIAAELVEKSWAGASRTMLALRWTPR